ncbi:zinc fingers and homeoboxes protein 2 [Elgaria multicarinata webbii]|uniref:zinc fingers and homeoboxes protein 2 n=1 Tax=Elgaria multicarinata webbii TaxID=159646 RepID=UPI002FCD0862
MASKRKSTTPCMVRASEAMEEGVPKDSNAGKALGSPEQDSGDAGKENCENDCEVIEGKSSPANPTRKPLGGYECKYCPFSTQNLNEFTEHIDTQHPNVILNPLYVCAECNFTTKKYDSLSEHNTKLHPGENNFKLKLIKLNNQTVLEQSIEISNNPIAAGIPEYEVVPVGASGTNKVLPIINIGKPKGEAKKNSMDNHLDGIPHLVTETTEPIACINGTELLQDILAHVMPSVQLPPNINLVPKVPVPLNSNKYNSALDTNATMINSFNKFPYPTQAELSWLTAASKHPEEQIRIWFATQRLKHGISWSPEEVEEARKKMFNGTIQTAPQTITVLPAHVTAAKMPQPLLQTAVPCQILSQTGLVLAQVSNGSNISPIALAVAANHGQKRSTQNQPAVPEPKRPHVVPAEVLPKQNTPATPTSTTTVPLSAMPPILSNDRKKTKEQIAALKASFIVSQFPDNAEIYKLIETTGLSRSEIKKWFSDHRYRSQRGIVNITSQSIAKDRIALAAARQGRAYCPIPDFTFETFKGKTQQQFGILEESFRKSSFPTQSELERLRTEAKMSRREVESWFTERRKLRDNMEQAVLDSMGPSMKNEAQGTSNGAISQTEKFNISQVPTSLSRCSAAFATSSQEQVHLLKSTFARTQWPSPQEYDELAAQTGLTRTEIVRWFKENRSSLRNGTLKWLDQYQQQYVIDGYNETKGTVPTGSLKNSIHEDQQPLKEKLEKQNIECTEKLECHSQDSQGTDENRDTGNVNWVEVTIDDDDDDAASDCMDSWSQSVPEHKADFDSESISGDNSHT